MPKGAPKPAPRSQEGSALRKSAFPIFAIPPVGREIEVGSRWMREAAWSTSPRASRPTVTTTMSMPSKRFGIPNE